MRSKKLEGEIRSHLPLFVALAATGFAGGLAAILQSYYLAGIIDGSFIGGLGLSELTGLIGLVIAAIVIRAAMIWAGEYLGSRFSTRIKTALRLRLLAALFAKGPVFADKERAGELVNTMTEGIENLDPYFASYVPHLVTVVTIPPLILAIVFFKDFTSALLMMVTAPLIPLFMILIGRWASRLQERQWSLLTFLSGHFFDNIAGLTTLKVFNRSKDQLQVIIRLSNQFRDSTLSVLKVAFLSAFALELLATLSTALVAVTVGLKLLYGTLTFHEAFFVLLLAPEYYLPLRQLGSHFHAGLAGVTAAEEIYSFLNEPAPQQQSIAPTPDWSGRQIAVHFDQVTASYDASRQPVLSEVSFDLRAGECLALVGPSGAGKSTIVDLLLGFIKPQQGTISINGQNLTELPLNDWLSAVAYVPQFPYLFYGTIADNVRFGMDREPNALEEACRNAGAHEFIARLPKGYHTIIGEGGQPLSGGETQRIAIARAYYKNAPLLILDEPATGLDPQNESLINQALQQLMSGKTVLVIAHRLSTAARADRLLVIEGGRLVQCGTHQDLAAQPGLYRQLALAYWGTS